MATILPGILVNSPEALRDRLTFSGFWTKDMTAHIDVLDGSIFGTTCCHDAMIVAPLYSTGADMPNIELHCMVRDPLPIITSWKRLVPQVIRASIHAEIDRPLDDAFARIRELAIECGLALNPETSPDVLLALHAAPDYVLVMGVHPGASGQTFLGEPILSKIRRIRSQYPSLPLCVDGGVSEQTLPAILHAGASSAVATSAIWNTKHPKESYEHLIHLS